MNQNFTSKILLKLCNAFEKREYEKTARNLEIDLEDTFLEIRNSSFNFDFQKLGKYYKTNAFTKQLVLRKLNENISRIYQVKQANRRLIINQVIKILEESSPYWVIKTDLKQFYESIDRKKIIRKLKDDTILSYHSVTLLEGIDNYFDDQNIEGLPRGLNISATLSEIYLRKFDKQIKKNFSVFFYARFVDDILIFCTSKQEAEGILKSLNATLPKGLLINMKKTQIHQGNAISETNALVYLGYKFWKKEVDDQKRLIISIADKKAKKIKTKIAKSIFNYIKDKNFELLVKRMRFLTGNYSIRNSDKTNDLLAGIFYNYPAINDFKILDELNLYYRKIISASKGNFGTKMKSLINPVQLIKLKKYSFKSGFKKRIVKRFTKDELIQITTCWK